MLIGAPELHHWHHDRDRDAGNYANLSPLMDLLFGTYRCPDREPAAFGLKHPGPRTYLGLLVRPLLPGRGGESRRRTTSAVCRDRLPSSPTAAGCHSPARTRTVTPARVVEWPG
jgi:hypothetical protein